MATLKKVLILARNLLDIALWLGEATQAKKAAQDDPEGLSWREVWLRQAQKGSP